MNKGNGKLVREQFHFVTKDLRDLRPVLDYLLAKKVLNNFYMREIEEKPTDHAKIKYLCEHIWQREEPAFSHFLDALLSTKQLDLAKHLDPSLDINNRMKALKLDDPRASGDGNCVSSGGGENNGSTSSSESKAPLLEPPTQQAMEQNEKFYRVEKKIFTEIPQTDGVMDNMRVIMCNGLPFTYKQDECYQHQSKPKGLAVIFNNRRFKKGILPERHGTDVDARNMSILLSQLGYDDVKVKNDLTSQEIKDAMSRFAFKSEHRKCDSAFVVVLTHGINGAFYGSDGNLIDIEEFISFLNAKNCPDLKGKPKVFIIQACRGESYDEGTDGLARAAGDHGDLADGNASHLERIVAHRQFSEKDEVDAIMEKTPTNADILIAYATTPGYVSWRNTMRGSWFIQGVCKVFEKEAHNEEILHLFTKVNRFVAEQLSGSGHKQVPEPSSRLRKKFFLLPGYPK